jgi:predicted P-loop ATPase
MRDQIQKVKEYYQNTAESIISQGLHLEKHGIKYKCYNRSAHKHNDKTPSMAWDRNNYQFKCFTCGWLCDVYEYYKKYENKSHAEILSSVGEVTAAKKPVARQQARGINLKFDKVTDVWTNYITKRGINLDIVNNNNIIAQKNNQLAFIYKDSIGNVIGAKYKTGKDKPKYISEKGSIFNFYNQQNINNYDYLIITEGEMDCLSFLSSNIPNTVSVPTGATGLSNLLQTEHNFLSKFKKLIIFSDNDEAGSKMDQLFIQKYPCILIDKDSMYCNCNDANEILVKYGRNKLIEIIEKVSKNEPKMIKNEPKTLKNNKNEKHPDFVKVKWNLNFVKVKYKDKNNNEIKTSLEDYYFNYPKKEDQPKILKWDFLPIKENVIALLKHYKIQIKYNILSNTPDVIYKEKSYKFEKVFVNIQDMCKKHNFKINKEDLLSICQKIAWENEYNPVEEYLKKCHKYYTRSVDLPTGNGGNVAEGGVEERERSDGVEERERSDGVEERERSDGVEEAKTELLKLCNSITCTEIFEPYKGTFISKFLMQMVWLICSKEEDDKTVQDYMLVLTGKQYAGKTTWFKNLLPSELRKDYFLEGRELNPFNKKDDMLEIFCNWLCELGEISTTFKKTDVESLKNFITSYKVKVRPPYAKEAITIKRRTCLCATTNETEFLRDMTGSRRFVVLDVINIDQKVKLNLELIWGYLYQRYLEGTVYKFTQEETNVIEQLNKSFTVKDELLELLEEYFDLYPAGSESDFWTTSEIYDYLIKKGIDMLSYKVGNPNNLGKRLKQFNVKQLRTKKCRGFLIKTIPVSTDNPFKNGN